MYKYFLPNYVITEKGEVINVLTAKHLIGDINNCGYRRVCINKKKYFIHRLVATYFIPNIHNKPIINHKDGNKRNNHVSNLEWATRSENDLHAFKLQLRKVHNRKK